MLNPAPHQPKRPVNLRVRADLLDAAKRAGLNLSRFLETSLDAALREERTRRWQDENRAAIEAINARIEKDGLWHKGLTPWY